MQIARRLDARKNPFNHGHGVLPKKCLQWGRRVPAAAMRRQLPRWR
jgi:hypothetical protein